MAQLAFTRSGAGAPLVLLHGLGSSRQAWDPVASLTLLSPAGLWRGNTPLYCRVSLRLSRWCARHAAGPLCRLMSNRQAAVAGHGAHPRAGDRRLRLA